MQCATIFPTLASPESSKSRFALTQINGSICLAQSELRRITNHGVSFSNDDSTSTVPPSTPGSTSSALSTVDATIFAHEFINIFRFSHRAVMHPADIHVIDSIDDDSARYEEENGTVFLSRDVMERFSKLTVRRPVRPIRQSRVRHAPRSSHTPPASAPAVLTHFSYPVR